MTRITYFITVHKHPPQVNRLLERIRTDEDICVLSAFNVWNDATRRTWHAVASRYPDFVVRARTSRHNIWGSFQQVTENLDAMRFAEELGFDYFVNLSAQCYPLWPPERIKSTLEESRKSHIEIGTYALDNNGELPATAGRPIRSALHWHGAPITVRRFTDWWCNPFTVRGKRVMLRVPNIKRRLPSGLQPCYGSGWFCLRREHVTAILDFARDHPEVLRFFSHNGIPIENFFNTLMWNLADHSELSSGNLRYESWDDGGVLILPFRASDVASLLSSKALWARKFDQTVDSAPLDAIDRTRFGLN